MFWNSFTACWESQEWRFAHDDTEPSVHVSSPSYTPNSFVMGTLLIPSVASWHGHVVDHCWCFDHLSNLSFEEGRRCKRHRLAEGCGSQAAFSLCPFSVSSCTKSILGQLSNPQDPLLLATQCSRSKLLEEMHQHSASFPGEFHHLGFFLWIPPTFARWFLCLRSKSVLVIGPQYWGLELYSEIYSRWPVIC